MDQFEEIYTQCRSAAERALFISLLLHAATDSQPLVSVVLTLREDYFGETRRHRELNQVISHREAHILVPGMTTEELRRAIVLPAQHTGRPIDPATTELLLHEARDREGALPLLELALTSIWNGIQDGCEPAVTLRKIGGVGGALADRAQKIYRGLSAAEQATARRSLVRLVQFGEEGTRDTRRRVSIRELCGHGETNDTVLSVLRQFATENARLVTLSSDGVDVVAEVTPEVLFEHWRELRDWINESRSERRFQDRVAEAARLWHEAGRPAGRLWRPPDLDLLRQYRRRRPKEMSSLQATFQLASERRQRRERLVGWGSAVTACMPVLLAAGVYNAKEHQRANLEQRRAQEARGAVERNRQQLLDLYVERGQRLFFEEKKSSEGLLWLHRSRAAASQNSMLPYLLRSAMESVDATKAVLVGHRSILHSATYSPDGRRIVTASEDRTARVWDASADSRSDKELAKLIRCHVPAHVEPAGGNLIVSAIPNPAECQADDRSAMSLPR